MTEFENRITLARASARTFKLWDYWLEDVSLWDKKTRTWHREMVFIDLMSENPEGRTIAERNEFGMFFFPN